jgi:hypothetical protein
MKRMPHEDQDLLASHISSSSLVISSEEESKEIRVHQVVYQCLQNNITPDEIKTDIDIVDFISSFSTLDSFDLNKTSDIIATRPLAPHFVAISTKLKQCKERHRRAVAYSADEIDCLSLR